MSGSKREEDTVTIGGVTCTHETDKAILVEIDGDEYWLPKSQLDASSDVREDGDEGDLVITQWIARQKGLA